MRRDKNTYFGGKGAEGTYQTVINHIRPHDVYIELFAGYASIAKKKRPAEKISILVELDTMVCFKLKEEFPDFEVRNISVFQFLLWLIEWHSKTNLRIVVYADPPYPVHTRSSNYKYKFDLTDAEHTSLLDLIKQLKCDVLLSTYPNDLYKNTLKDWRLIEYMNKTHSGMAKEWLFMNYHEVNELHDDRYLGVTHRERQLIKKKARRWAKNFAQLPQLQQNLILKKLSNIHSGR